MADTTTTAAATTAGSCVLPSVASTTSQPLGALSLPLVTHHDELGGVKNNKELLLGCHGGSGGIGNPSDFGYYSGSLDPSAVSSSLRPIGDSSGENAFPLFSVLYRE